MIDQEKNKSQNASQINGWA